MTAESIKPARLADSVADHLERLILEGVLHPGERLLPERDLAAKLDISRPSLREAIDKLTRQGLLRSTPNGATYVEDRLGAAFKDPLMALLRRHPEATFDYLEFRRGVEGTAAFHAARRATDIDRAAIAACIERMTASHGQDDSSEEAEADADLHLSVYEAAHNMVLLHVMRSLSDMLRSDVFYNRDALYARKGVRDLLLDQHLAIAQAVIDGDADRARAAAEQHLAFTHETLLEIREAEARREASLRRVEGADLIDSARSKKP